MHKPRYKLPVFGHLGGKNPNGYQFVKDRAIFGRGSRQQELRAFTPGSIMKDRIQEHHAKQVAQAVKNRRKAFWDNSKLKKKAIRKTNRHEKLRKILVRADMLNGLSKKERRNVTQVLSRPPLN